MPKCQHQRHSTTGSDLINYLTGILCRFQHERVIVVCDVRKMFYQFRVNEEHRNLFSYPVVQGRQDRIQPYQIPIESPPFWRCVPYSRLHQAELLCRRRINLGTNCRSSCRSNNKHQGTLCKEGIGLHQYASKDKEVLKSIPVDERAGCVRDIEVIGNSTEYPMVLKGDCLRFCITLTDSPAIRRGTRSL